MDSIRQLLERLDRVLALAEGWLGARAPRDLEPEVLARYHAFRFDPGLAGPHGGHLLPVESPGGFDLDDLIGVDRSVARLLRNTEQFVEGLPFNHVLLHGERGTGKSSAVRGLLTRYAERGLRIIEIRRDDLEALPRLLPALRDQKQRFLLFCDDLSFGEGEAGYRELKAVLEGGVTTAPENVCLIVTSNRRHLLPQRRSENQAVHLDADGDLHLGEALEEKLALAERFGLVLAFYGFDQKTYLAIVSHYVAQSGIDVPEELLREEALRWALDRSSRSGRTARQFVDDLVGRHRLKARHREDGLGG
ncbi:MAG: ATP-binding protein [Myxococcota bacterium]|nr:ATP-binding protein [Myxococcota bacterium]